MTWPHGRYLDYLTGIATLDDVEVRHMLDRDGFPPMDDADLVRVRYLLDQPPDFDAFDEGHAASQAWLRQRGLQGVVRGDASVLQAFRLLRSPSRLPVEVLLLGGMTSASIAEFLARNRAGTWSENTIGRFASMFFAVDEMAGDDLIEYDRQAPNGEVYKELLARGPDAAVELAERLLQRTATWPWAKAMPTATP